MMNEIRDEHPLHTASLPPGEHDEARAATSASYRAVVGNRPFLALWIAQILSQLAQNLTWIVLGAFVADQTHRATLVSVTTVSALLAPLLFSAAAGVLVDRASKRRVLVGSNLVRVVLTLLFIGSTDLAVAVQTTVIIVLIFIANVVSQFFAPAEAATIPLLVEKRNLIVASSLFNITFNVCQIIPVTLGLLLYSLFGITPLLFGVAALYTGATALVAILPRRTAVVRRMSMESPYAAVGHVVNDLREVWRVLSHDRALRRMLFQINVAPTFTFVFLPLGLIFVPQTFGLAPNSAWILLLPAGVGLIAGAAAMGRIAAHARKETLLHIGLLALGAGITLLGVLALLIDAFHQRPHGVSAQPHNLGLIVPAMVLALLIGLSMALSSIPAQTLIFERTAPQVRGRVLAMQQFVGGALPIIPLLTISPLADLLGTATVMTGLGILIALIGVWSVRIDRGERRHHPSRPLR